jgi:hypothetical protein
VWDELGRRVYRNNPPQTFQELRNRLMLEWQNMLQDVIRQCVDSMRKRCQACIALEVDIQPTNPVSSATFLPCETTFQLTGFQTNPEK